MCGFFGQSSLINGLMVFLERINAKILVIFTARSDSTLLALIQPIVCNLTADGDVDVGGRELVVL